jgi:hypothetical protein
MWSFWIVKTIGTIESHNLHLGMWKPSHNFRQKIVISLSRNEMLPTCPIGHQEKIET